MWVCISTRWLPDYEDIKLPCRVTLPICNYIRCLLVPLAQSNNFMYHEETDCIVSWQTVFLCAIALIVAEENTWLFCYHAYITLRSCHTLILFCWYVDAKSGWFLWGPDVINMLRVVVSMIKHIGIGFRYTRNIASSSLKHLWHYKWIYVFACVQWVVCNESGMFQHTDV